MRPTLRTPQQPHPCQYQLLTPLLHRPHPKALPRALTLTKAPPSRPIKVERPAERRRGREGGTGRLPGMRRPAGTSLAKDGEEVAAKGSWTIGGDEIRREIRREMKRRVLA